MPTRAQVIEEARKLIGTPFRHQGREPGVGVDCSGEIAVVARALSIPILDCLDYSREPDPVKMREHLAANLDQIPIEEARIGDILFLWFVDKAIPQHLAFKSPVGIIHAFYRGIERGGRDRSSRASRVVETTLGTYWAERIDSAWRFPGLED